MTWKTIEQERLIGFGPTDTRVEVIYHLEIPEEDWSQLEAAMVEFWVRFCEAISKEYAGNFDEVEAINLSFRPDDGMLYAQPRLQRRKPVLKERTEAMAYSLLVEGLWFDLPDSDTDPAGFDSAHDEFDDQMDRMRARRLSKARGERSDCIALAEASDEDLRL